MASNGETKIVKAEIVAPTPTSILQMAVQQGANVDTLAKLLELQERFEANEARKAFEVAFAAFKQEAPKLEKSKLVAFKEVKYKYTPLDEIANTLGPVLARHGLSYNWRQQSDKESISVTCILRHTQGHSIENNLNASPDNSGSKNSIQAIGSAVTYLRRYTLLGVLGMATSDDDNDGMTMNNAADFLANFESAANMDELAKRYKEAIAAALQARDPKAVDVFMQARKKHEARLRAA